MPYLQPIHGRPDYEVLHLNDTHILLIDLDNGPSITNQPEKVIGHLSLRVGGIGQRRVYYRDTDGRYDELIVHNERFVSFRPCTDHQQLFLADIAHRSNRW